MFALFPLLWRSFRIRKRFYFRTFFELAFPMVMTGLLIYIGHDMSPNDSHHFNGTEPEKSSKAELFHTFKSWEHSYIYYCPETNMTRSIMNQVTSAMNAIVSDRNKIIVKNFSSCGEMEKELFDIFGNDTVISVLGYGVEFQQKEKSNDFTYDIRNTQGDSWQTNLNFPNFQVPGPGNNNGQYISYGFLGLQSLINDAILKYKNIQSPTNFTMQEFPYPAYDDATGFSNMFTSLIPSFILYGYTVLVMIVNLVVEEKNSGSREWMRMTGMSNFNLWFSWLLHSMSLYFITVTLTSILFTVELFGHVFLTSPGFLFLWILLFLFCTNTVMALLCVCNPISNTTVSSVVGFIFYFAPSVVFDQLNKKYAFSAAVKAITCLFPTASLNWAFLSISAFEASREPITFRDLFLNHGSNNLPLGIIFICQIVSGLVYSLLLVYIDAVIPGQYGRARPWYFIFQSLSKYISTAPSSESKDIPENKSCLYEKIVDRPVGLRFHELKKTFGHFTAVNGLSIDIYQGQITALLGHNGAGKTTLINIITGMYSPTEGCVYQDGKNVFDNFFEYQKKIGLCPQHNLLLPYLTVSEHIIFFGMMRGLSKANATVESRNLLDFFGILSKSNKLIKKLSGGMKRKLCLSISLVGDPKLLILDEPTSGMDPESRRDTWNKLLSLRGNRTVILTTHFMEEADVLGDMIAIMDHGTLKCYGTPMFLKRNYGAGYQLKCTTQYDYNTIYETVRSIVPSASLKMFKGSELVISLPLGSESSFPHLFSTLETNSNLGITNISVACSTMEDVFLRVDQLQEKDEVDSKLNYSLLTDHENDDPVHGSREEFTSEPLSGFSLEMSRFNALVKKKFLYSYRHWKGLLYFNCFIPIWMFFIVTSLTSAILGASAPSAAINLELSTYGDTKVLLRGIESPLINAYENVIKAEKSDIQKLAVTENITNALLSHATENEGFYRSKMIISTELTDLPNLLYSTIAYHSPPIALTTFYNAILKVNSSFKIVTHNHPYNFKTGSCTSPNVIVITAFSVGIIWLFFLPLVLTLITCNFCKLCHDERLKSGKLLQYMTGTSPILYWVSAYIIDVCIYVMSCLLIILVIYLSDSVHIFSSAESYGLLLLLLFLPGLCNIWFTYFMSLFLDTYSTLHSLLTYLCIILGEIFLIVVTILKMNGILKELGQQIFNVIHYIFLFYPSYNVSSLTVKVLKYVSAISLFKNCGFPNILEVEFYSWAEETGIYQEILFLCINTAIYFIALLMVDYGIFGEMVNKLSIFLVGSVDVPSSIDSDVLSEKEVVRTDLSAGKAERGHYVITDSIAKKYSKTHTAVKDVSFRVKKGECFGLLGVNGAGKSTTFKILTGDIFPTKGNSLIFGTSLQEDRLKYQSFIGYCPQTDGIINCLTGKEMLHLYAALRGVNPVNFDRCVSKWISDFGLAKYYNKKCGTYSGGNKRKLSTAISLIGDPPLILLDEPTTGVDPVARRKFWNILSHLQSRGQTVIITSHSMDECEAVCDRLTIMAEGEMKCIGSVSQLKSKYGRGFTLLIKLGPHTADHLTQIKSAVQDKFYPDYALRDEHIGLLHYHIYSDTYKWSEVFSTVESIKSSFSQIQDYVVTETTLEQVFLFFARKSD